jgi:hypothetical protein
MWWTVKLSNNLFSLRSLQILSVRCPQSRLLSIDSFLNGVFSETMSMENVPGQTPRTNGILPFLLVHRKKLFSVLLFLCFVAALCFAGRAWRKFRIRRAQSIFASLQANPTALAAFADRYKSMTLGALASFASGNYSAFSEDFSSAAAAYGRCSPLKAAKLDGAASVASAICCLRSGNVQLAEKTLLSVIDDRLQPDSIRAAAYYFRALAAWENGQRTVARASLDAMSQLQDRGPWAGRALLLSLALR